MRGPISISTCNYTRAGGNDFPSPRGKYGTGQVGVCVCVCEKERERFREGETQQIVESFPVAVPLHDNTAGHL